MIMNRYTVYLQSLASLTYVEPKEPSELIIRLVRQHNMFAKCLCREFICNWLVVNGLQDVVFIARAWMQVEMLLSHYAAKITLCHFHSRNWTFPCEVCDQDAHEPSECNFNIGEQRFQVVQNNLFCTTQEESNNCHRKLEMRAFIEKATIIEVVVIHISPIFTPFF